jgi:hypothetical protein
VISAIRLLPYPCKISPLKYFEIPLLRCSNATGINSQEQVCTERASGNLEGGDHGADFREVTDGLSSLHCHNASCILMFRKWTRLET